MKFIYSKKVVTHQISVLIQMGVGFMYIKKMVNTNIGNSEKSLFENQICKMHIIIYYYSLIMSKQVHRDQWTVDKHTHTHTALQNQNILEIKERK